MHWVQRDGESVQFEHPLLQDRHWSNCEGDNMVDIVESGQVDRHCADVGFIV